MDDRDFSPFDATAILILLTPAFAHPNHHLFKGAT
jgi:hypothetical protein